MRKGARPVFTLVDPADPSLFPSQSAALREGLLSSDQNWLICAPTGSGKTKIAEWCLLDRIQRGDIGVYIAPLKAIVEERLRDWETRLSGVSVGLFTGDRFTQAGSGKPDNRDLLLLTPEKLASYLNSWKSNLSWLSRIGVLVVDEIHLLGDPGRGTGLECLLTRLRRINPFARIVGLSGTLSNAQTIANWLNAYLFVSDWRPIPVQHRIVRFSKAADKLTLLHEELKVTVNEGGRALVFTNSRRRSEQLVHTLSAEGIKCAFTHAGLTPEKRQTAQALLHAGEIDALITTSSLEMGVNFPARKVIIYDSYGFNGETFGPISVARYLQAAGRAGRAGLDTHGESVLFIPKWAGSEPDYLSRIPEPVESGLFKRRNQASEVLADVVGRLSISDEHLSTNFAKRTLWKQQGGSGDFGGLVSDLLTNGFLRRDQKSEVYLSATTLGRIACQMAVSPDTVSLFVRCFEAVPVPTDFDILLIGCLTAECTPKLGFNFEEIDHLGDKLMSVPSTILDRPIQTLEDLFRVNGRTVLSAIKSAILLQQHIDGTSIED